MHAMQYEGPDPVETLERLDTYLRRVAECHVAGLAWNGVPVDHLDVLRPPPDRRDPGRVLGVPAAGDRRAMQRDVQSMRRLIALVAGRLRYGSDCRPMTIGIAEGMLTAREATTVSDMRNRMLTEVLARLRHIRRSVMRRIDALGSVNIRLDAWTEVGTSGRADVRAYLDRVLQQQADFASHGRSSLGQLVEARRHLDLAKDRVEARVRGEWLDVTRADTCPLTLPAMAPHGASSAGCA